MDGFCGERESEIASGCNVNLIPHSWNLNQDFWFLYSTKILLQKNDRGEVIMWKKTGSTRRRYWRRKRRSLKKPYQHSIAYSLSLLRFAWLVDIFTKKKELRAKSILFNYYHAMKWTHKRGQKKNGNNAKVLSGS